MHIYIFLSSFVSVCLVINVEYPQGENAPILSFLSLSELTDSSPLSHYAPSLPLHLPCPDFFLISQNLFDLH